MLKPALRASLLATVAAIVMSGPVRAQTSQPIRPWLENHFQAVGQSCNPDFRKRNSGTVIPRDVRELLGARLGESAFVYDRDSLNRYFARVYRRQNGGIVGVGNPLGMPYSHASGVIVDGDVDTLTRQNNCTTLLSANADTSFNLNLAGVRAALSAAATSRTSQTALLYSGEMISPVAAAVGAYGTLTDAPPGIDRFSAWLSIWWWYLTQPTLVEPGEAGELEIASHIDGLAVYRYVGLSQMAMLEGSTNVAGSVPFLSVRAAGTGQGQWGVDTRAADFSVAVVQRFPTNLPKPSMVISDAPALARFTAAPTNKQAIEDGSPLDLTYVLGGVPSNYCVQSRWNLKPEEAPSGHAAISNLRLQPGDNNSCVFTVTAIPPATAQAEGRVRVGFTVQVPITGAANTPTLVLPTPQWTLADNRAAISLLPTSAGAGSYQLPETLSLGVASPVLQLSWPVRERLENRKTSGVESGQSALTWTCGESAPRSATIPVGGLGWSRTGPDAAVALNLPIPIDLAPASTVDPVECRLDGALRMTVQGAPAVTVELPTYTFFVTRPPVATAPRQSLP